MALLIPALVMVAALTLSYQSSMARRMTSSVWTTYVALELAESAVAEAAHFLRPEHVLPKEVVDQVPTTGDFPTEFLRKMVSDDDPDPAKKLDASRLSGVAAYEYRTIRAGSTVKKKMLVALHFLGSVPVKRVLKKEAGLTAAQKIAQENSGIPKVN